jgi:branched-chain amino acid transport system ATP-binding protein
MMAEPRILLIDEPSLGLAPVIVQEIFNILRQLKKEGVTIVLVEQNTHMALAVADRVYMLRSGRVVLDKPAAEVDVAKLHDLYFALEA